MSEFVKLKYGKSETFAPGGGIGNVEITQASAKVVNLGFQKGVAIRYRQPDGSWAERSLSWQRNFGDYDLFSGDFNDFTTNQFAIRYSVNGQTFWDNNSFADYHADTVHPNVVAELKVILNKAVAKRGNQAGGGFVFTTSWAEGEIYVQNRSFNKRVGIRLTANNWATSHDTDAAYGGLVPVAAGASAVEVWKFKTPEFNLDESTSDFQFAIYYHDHDTGEWFWDNNFGRNYRLSKTDAATIE
jgi:hypothetical protein